MVTAKGATAFANAVGNAPVCVNSSVIPVGTPVSEPIEHQGQRVKVTLLDALWHWAPPIKCDAIHTGAVWVESSAIGTDFPARRLPPALSDRQALLTASPVYHPGMRAWSGGG